MDDRFRTHVTKDLTRGGSFPLSAVTSARLLRVTTPPGSSKDRGKTSCPQQLAQPRTTRDHQQGNGLGRYDVLKVVEEAPDDLGTARERVNLFLDVAEPTAQLGCNGGAGSQRTAFRGAGEHRPDK